MHRDGSGLVTLRGLTNQCRARFRVSFGGNIAIPTGGTVGPISLAIAIDGEAVATTTMISTPAAHWIRTNTLSILSALPLPLEYCGICIAFADGRSASSVTHYYFPFR